MLERDYYTVINLIVSCSILEVAMVKHHLLFSTLHRNKVATHPSLQVVINPHQVATHPNSRVVIHPKQVVAILLNQEAILHSLVAILHNQVDILHQAEVATLQLQVVIHLLVVHLLMANHLPLKLLER